MLTLPVPGKAWTKHIFEVTRLKGYTNLAIRETGCFDHKRSTRWNRRTSQGEREREERNLPFIETKAGKEWFGRRWFQQQDQSTQNSSRISQGPHRINGQIRDILKYPTQIAKNIHRKEKKELGKTSFRAPKGGKVGAKKGKHIVLSIHIVSEESKRLVKQIRDAKEVRRCGPRKVHFSTEIKATSTYGFLKWSKGAIIRIIIISVPSARQIINGMEWLRISISVESKHLGRR